MKLILAILLVMFVVTTVVLVTEQPVLAQKQILHKGDVPGVSNVSPEQRQSIINIRQDARKQLRAIMADSRLTDQQKEDRMSAVIDKTHAAVMNQLTPAQRQQFDRWYSSRVEGPMMRQGAGAGAGPQDPLLFRVPGVPSSSLSADQKQQIATIRLDTMSKVNDIEDNPNLSEQDKMNQISQARMQAHQQVVAVLNPEQVQQFENWWASPGGGQ
jgi:Spy/CpxP family protein refolding chaperone